MKRLTLITSALLASTILGHAADMPAKGSAPVVTPAYTWTGAYVDADLGYGWGANGLQLQTVPALPISVDAGLAPHGVTLGGGVGYDYQLGTSFVVGAVTDISWSDIRDSNAIVSTPGFGVNASSKLDWFGTTRAKAGYLVTPSLLVYATGGAAYGGASATGSITGCTGCSLTANGTNVGWTVGGGLEYAITNTWRAKAEWLHMDLGSISACAAVGKPGSGNCIGFSDKVTDDVYRVGVVYKFMP